MSDIQAGDLVVELSMEACTVGGHDPDDATPETVGRICRVISTGPWWDGRQRISIGDHNGRDGDNWCGGCFRKLNDEPDNAELVERIKACKPMKQPALADRLALNQNGGGA